MRAYGGLFRERARNAGAEFLSGRTGLSLPAVAGRLHRKRESTFRPSARRAQFARARSRRVVAAAARPREAPYGLVHDWQLERQEYLCQPRWCAPQFCNVDVPWDI